MSAFLVAVVSAFVIAALVFPRRQVRALTDGAVLTLEAADLIKKGGSYRYAAAGGTGLRALFPASTGSYIENSASDSLHFRVHQRGGVDPRRGTSWWLRDEHGCRYPVWGGWQGISAPTTGALLGPVTEFGSQLRADAFPRRGGATTLDYVLDRNNAILTSFRVPNLPSGEFPRWQAEPFPIRARSGDLAFVLDGLRWSESDGGSEPLARFRVLQNGNRTDGWNAAWVEVSDSTGNVIGHTVESRSGEVRLPGLCRKETAWRISAEFARSEPLRAAPDFTLQATAIPLPAAGNVSRPIAEVEHAGFRVRLRGVAGTGDVSWQSGQISMGGSRPYAQLEIAPAGTGLLMTLAAVKFHAADGRELKPAGTPRPSDVTQLLEATSTHFRFPLNTPRGAKSVDLTFRFHRSHRVSFLASPQ